MTGDPKCWRDLCAGLRGLGGAPVRIRGSHEIWRLDDGRTFIVVCNHLADAVPKKILARYRRLCPRRSELLKPEGGPSQPRAIRAMVARIAPRSVRRKCPTAKARTPTASART
ncbi:MAG: type II toxin-antitoxin system HicA family toxin [Deltaproteobacteria bacterium]|nr:type II toxin-antitoxin system HicA family toxin [Deltaproteobacteria bacterium]